MTVIEAYVGGKKIDPPDSSSHLSSRLKSLLIKGIAQNSNGIVYVPENGGDVEVSGSPTEKAILQWGVKLGMNFELVRSESSIIHFCPFSSDKKRGGVAIKLPHSEVHIHWKGAAEIVLASCTKYMDANDRSVEMDEDKKTYFIEVIKDMAAGGLRCIAIAHKSCHLKDIPPDGQLAKWALPEDELTLLAIVGIQDPCRPGVKDAVKLCQNAGVKVQKPSEFFFEGVIAEMPHRKVCMVTGDNLQTAKAIALECGILDSNADATEPNIIEGKSFRSLSVAQREEIAEKILVMGRSSPSDKLLLVQALRRRGHIVAATGDGAKDALALHEANVGFAMGIHGTHMAKEKSDIVILDDNFVSVVKVISWGRSVYANIQKFIQFQLAVNVAAIVINVVCAVSSGDIPNAVQLLWVNLIMDTIGALALTAEPPVHQLMHRPPVGWSEPLITNIMWRNLLIQAAYQVSILLFLSFRGRSLLNLEHDTIDHANDVKNTLIFNAFILCQIFNIFNARKPDEFNVFKGVTKSHLFMWIVGLTLVSQVIIIEFLGKFTLTVRLNWKQWIICIAIAFVSWPLDLVSKLIPVPRTPVGLYFSRMFRTCCPQRNPRS